MYHFKNVSSQDELKKVYRRLAILYHPDKGGCLNIMQEINNEYARLSDNIGKTPENLTEVKVGNIIYVNKTRCIVTQVEKDRFKARSLNTGREAYFSKTTGYAMLNLKLRADIYSN